MIRLANLHFNSSYNFSAPFVFRIWRVGVVLSLFFPPPPASPHIMAEVLQTTIKYKHVDPLNLQHIFTVRFARIFLIITGVLFLQIVGIYLVSP